MSAQVVAVDLGGTKTAVAKVDSSYKISNLTTVPTYKQKEALLNSLTAEIKKLAPYQAVGLAVAGTVNSSGVIISAPNLPLAGVNIKEILSKALAVRVFLDNDANLAALGEKTKGVAKPFNNFILLTLGTGIGGGIFLNGQLYRGYQGAAGEVGHMVVKAGGPLCACGRLGCLEALASGTALENQAAELIRQKPTANLAQASQQKQTLDGQFLAEMAKQGDRDALQLWQQLGYFLGIGIGSLINIFNPEAVVLGGGLMAEAKLFLEIAKEAARKTVIDRRAQKTPVISGVLGPKAGLIGAAALAFASFKS